MCKKEVVVGDIFAEYDNPIAEVVQKACCYDSEIFVHAGQCKVNMKSIMGIMAVKWNKGTSVEIAAEGDDAQKAIEDIGEYLACFN
jgi:phosphocarrier protein